MSNAKKKVKGTNKQKKTKKSNMKLIEKKQAEIYIMIRNINILKERVGRMEKVAMAEEQKLFELEKQEGS